MENKIPIPTDNIFKFYALFGLFLFVFGVGSIIYVTRSTNELVYQSVPELEAIKQIPNPSFVDAAKMRLLEKRLEIAAADKRAFIFGIGILVGTSLILMFYGFGKWHTKVQPVQDEIARLQLEKLRYEVRQLKHPNPPIKPAHEAPPKLNAGNA